MDADNVPQGMGAGKLRLMGGEPFGIKFIYIDFFFCKLHSLARASKYGVQLPKYGGGRAN